MLILADSGFGSDRHRKAALSTYDDGQFLAPHNAGPCAERGHAPHSNSHFRAATEPAAALELLQRVRQVLGETRDALGGFGWETDVGKAGGVPEAVDEELISSAGQRTGCDSFCSECYRCVNESSYRCKADGSASARDQCSDKVADSGLRSGPDRVLPAGIGDVMSRLCHLEDPGYDPFRGKSLEELGKERQKWTACRKFFENELRANHCQAAKMS